MEDKTLADVHGWAEKQRSSFAEQAGTRYLVDAERAAVEAEARAVAEQRAAVEAEQQALAAKQADVIRTMTRGPVGGSQEPFAPVGQDIHEDMARIYELANSEADPGDTLNQISRIARGWIED